MSFTLAPYIIPALLVLVLTQGFSKPTGQLFTIARVRSEPRIRIIEGDGRGRSDHHANLIRVGSKLRATRDMLALRGGGGEMTASARYRTRWSSVHKADFLTLSEDMLVATCPPDSEGSEHHFLDESAYYPDAWTVRAEDPIPQEGLHYFEVELRQLHVPEGHWLEDGFNTVGLVGEGEDNWLDFWWEDDRRQHTFGLHDSQMSFYVSRSHPPQECEYWAEGGSFGCGDRIGFLVDMKNRSAQAFKNGTLLGTAFTDLPDVVYPFVTMASERITAELTFPPAPLTWEPQKLPTIFGTPGTPGSAYGACKIPEHSELGCTGLCDLQNMVSRQHWKDIWGDSESSDVTQQKLNKQVQDASGMTATLKGEAMLRKIRKTKLSSAQEEHNRVLNVQDPKLRGLSLKDSINTAPNHAIVYVDTSLHKWQTFKSYLQVMKHVEDDNPEDVYTLKEMLQTWHWEDVIVLTKDCGIKVIGADRAGSIMWGRWQFRNVTNGSISDATLLSEPPSFWDYTLEVWGNWSWDRCNLRSAGGIVMHVSFDGNVEVNNCTIGGDGLEMRRARVGVEASLHGNVVLRDSLIHYVGVHLTSYGLSAQDWAKMRVLRCTAREMEVFLDMDWEADVFVTESTVEPMSIGVFLHSGDFDVADKAREQNETLEWPYDCLRHRSHLKLVSNTFYLNPSGIEDLWVDEFRPVHLEDLHNTYVENPSPLPLVEFPPSAAHVFNGSAPEFVGLLKIHHPSIYECVMKVMNHSKEENERIANATRKSSAIVQKLSKVEQRRLERRKIKIRDVGPSGKFMCLKGHECLFQYMDTDHAERYDHTNLAEYAEAQQFRNATQPRGSGSSDSDDDVAKDVTSRQRAIKELDARSKHEESDVEMSDVESHSNEGKADDDEEDDQSESVSSGNNSSNILDDLSSW